MDGRQSQQSASEISQGQLLNRLNKDLSRHLEAILICVNSCKIVEGNADRNIVERLAEQVQQELRLALAAEQISSLGGKPTIKLHPVGDQTRPKKCSVPSLKATLRTFAATSNGFADAKPWANTQWPGKFVKPYSVRSSTKSI